MDCPKCGYEMSPFDAECPRCKRMAAMGKDPAGASLAVGPSPLIATGAPLVASPPLLRAGAFVGSAMAGHGVGNLFGTFLKVCFGGG